MSSSDDLFNILLGGVDLHEEEVRENYVRAPFGWAGGKEESKQHILDALPYREAYIETCGGSGVIMLNRRRSKLEVFNDRDSGVTAFYRVIKDKAKLDKMVEWLSLTIHSREEFMWCKETWRNHQDDVERAARWYYMVRMSFSQQRRNFARATRGYGQHPQMIYNSLPLFGMIHERFSTVQVENLDLMQCIKDFDHKGAVFYIDPNYVNAASGIYDNEIDKHQHYQLCETIMRSKGFFALSGYANPIYDSNQYNWDRRLTWNVRIKSQTKALTGTNHRPDGHAYTREPEAEEVLWIRDNS